MKPSRLFLQLILWLLVFPALACGPLARLNVTPTPTKTPTPLKPLGEVPTATPTELLVPTPTVVTVPPTDTPLPEAVLPTDTPPPAEAAEPIDTPTPEPVPPTDTPVPPPPPTNTPAPPPPPTNTPAPLPPTNTPAPPPPSNSAPTVIIELPNGDTYGIGDNVKLIITVRDPDGIGAFSWGVFTENKVGLVGDEINCNNATECRVEEEFTTKLAGAFQIGVEVKDTKGEGKIEIKQLYVG